ncbi:MAG TPA: hypothetical protein VIR57_02795, partial [Chloroflexota bacterium]
VSHNTAKRELTELVAARLVLPFGGARTRRYALSPLTLLPLPDSRLPTLDSGPGSGPYLAGSPGQEPSLVGITIDPISLRRPCSVLKCQPIPPPKNYPPQTGPQPPMLLPMIFGLVVAHEAVRLPAFAPHFSGETTLASIVRQSRLPRSAFEK